MILVDTSVWIDHFRSPFPELTDLVRQRAVRLHPFVLGELALGHLPDRERTLLDLADQRGARVASHSEAMHLLQSHDLSGRGIGYVDLHLLASARLEAGHRLWTRDRRLGAVAEILGVGFLRQGHA